MKTTLHVFLNLLHLSVLQLSSVFIVLCSSLVFGQTYEDNALNYSGTWTDGSNEGNGYNPWVLSTNTNSGFFIGNPSADGMGTNGIGSTAFALYATGSNYVNVTRTFQNGMQVGDSFSFYWAMNFDANGGNKGFDILNGTSVIINVNNSNSQTINANINGSSVVANSGYGTIPMLVTIKRVSTTQYEFSMTARDGGSTFTALSNSTLPVNGIKFYCGAQNEGSGQRNIYFNNFLYTYGTHYDGSSWSRSEPTSAIDAYIEGDLTTVSDLTCKNLTVDSGITLTVASTNSLSVSGDFNNNGSVIFKSDINGTATFTSFDGVVSGSGTATVERYIPAKRAWRLLTAPLKGTTNNTIADNWQGTTNEGLLLFSPATFQSQAMTGYATGGNAPNIYQYGTSWQIIPDLNSEAIFGADATDTKAYQVFVTGGHGSSNIATGSQATTLRSTGELITGNVTHTLTANTYKLIANPYASPLNTEALVQANSGSKAWLLDPSVGFGAYVTYDGANWSITPSGNDANIQSGQGFLVRSTGTSFEIQESHKTTGNSNTWFERNASSTADKIRVLLYKAINNEWQLADGILAVNSADGNTAVDNTDAGKVSNFNESMMFRNGTNNLSIEYRALPQANEVQPIRLTGTAVTSYELRLFTENYNNSSLVPMLEDTQTGTFTTIPTDGSIVSVPFTGVVATGTNPDNRFRIVYQAALSNDVFNALHVSVYPNPVNEGFLNINLLEAGKATYNLYNLVGQEVLTGTLMTQNSQLTLSSLQTGVYILSIEQAGKKHTTKVVVE